MITNLRCEYAVEPLGIDTQKPFFSWNIENDKFSMQKTYRIIVQDGKKIMWDSGVYEGYKEIGISYEGLQLKSLKKYTFLLTVKMINNEVYESESFFVTGLLTKQDVNAKWIIHSDYHDNPIFYKNISIKGEISQAYIAISGLGYYHCTINDVKCHDTYLVPGYTDYMERNLSQLQFSYDNNSRKRVLYNTYDIKKFFKKGSNSLKIELGTGWFAQSERNIEGDMSYGCPRLFAKIIIDYVNGEKQEIITDDSFFVTEGSYELNNIYYGEIYNDNIGRDFSYKYNAEVCKDEMGQLQSQFSGFDKVINQSSMKLLKSNIYEAPLNMTGWVKVTATGLRGAKMTIKYFEEFDEQGNPDYHSCGGEWQLQQDTYIFFNNEQVVYEPKFTWHGFNYCQIEADEDIIINKVEAITIHADTPITSSVETDNETINWLYKTYINTQLSNYHGGVPSDCPHRERLGYTGDGHITAKSALFSLDSINFYRKWNKDIIYSQNTETGFIPHTVPFYGGGGGPAWGMAVIIIPYLLYQHSFDIRILEDSYEAIKGWIAYLEGKCTDYIIDREEDGSWCLGEWCLPVEGYTVVQTDLTKLFGYLDPKLVNTCYFYNVLEITEYISSILGNDISEYTNLKNKVKIAINENFLNSDTGKYDKGEYGANIYPLYFNIVPAKSKNIVLNALITDIKANNYHMNTGIFATAMLPDVLINNNYGLILDEIFKVNDYPSFGYMKAKGATTLWETWNKNASINHPMFGGIVSYFFTYLAGIKYMNSKNEILISPVFNTGVNKCNIKYKSIYGEIAVSWEITKSIINVKITIPCNVKAAFLYNGKHHILDKIINEFTLEKMNG